MNNLGALSPIEGIVYGIIVSAAENNESILQSSISAIVDNSVKSSGFSCDHIVDFLAMKGFIKVSSKYKDKEIRL